MSKTANTLNIPSFLKVKTPELLMSSMLENNAKRGKEYKYFDISFVKGFWYAWYYEDFSRLAINNAIVKGEDNG